MRTRSLLGSLLLGLTLSAGCDAGAKDKSAGAEAGGAKGGDAKSEESDSSAKAPAGPRFDKGTSKRGCDLLTAKMVAETFAVPEDELKQISMMGCMYSWDGEDQELDTRLMSIHVGRSVEAATTYFENATRGMSQVEIAEAMGKMKESAKAQGKLQGESQDKAADGIVGAIGGMAGADGFQFEDVAGIGDQARGSLDDGAVWVRVSNLVFSVGAYKGAVMPPPELPSGAKDPAGFQVAMIEAVNAWGAKTLGQRKRDSQALAKVVVAAL